MTLSELKPGQLASISGFSHHGVMTQRMMQLGLLEGSEVAMIRKAPAGGLIEIKVMNYALSLRREEASLVQVQPMSQTR